MLMAGEHHSFELQSDWDEIGIKHFSFHILELCDDNQLKEKEIYWILKKESEVKGYNMTTFHVSAEKLHAENNRLKKENSYLKNLLNIDVDEIFKLGRHPRSLANLTQNKNKKQTEMIDPIKLKDGESEEERKELRRRKLDRLTEEKRKEKEQIAKEKQKEREQIAEEKRKKKEQLAKEKLREKELIEKIQFKKACSIVIEAQSASVSMLQRKLKIVIQEQQDL
jgi:hypothetical protein